ncbi:MAG: hypothetical protein LJE67_15850 [Salaquimonas sp.]|jgi:hypothetical protein|nr:hypothetical protein [Salaquimonas sp.]
MTEAEYSEYISTFNAACAGDGTGFAAFFDRYYEPDAVFEYIPNATRNSGRDFTIRFWQGVHEQMQETIRPHISFLNVGSTMASEAPIDFRCKRDLEWVGIPHKKDTSFRLMMAAFYELSPAKKIRYARVYSIFNEAYQPDP